MNYRLLATEIAKEQYKGLDDQAVADALNAPTITAVRNVPIAEIAEWAAQNGVMAALFAAERDPATPAPLYGAIRTLLAILAPGLLDEWKILDQDGAATPGAQGITVGLVQAGLLSPEQVVELMQMAFTATSWAALNWTGEIAYWDVARARAINAN